MVPISKAPLTESGGTGLSAGTPVWTWKEPLVVKKSLSILPR